MREGIQITKGHGTENDFIVVFDPEARLEIEARRIASWCDRRAGLGADGVLRAVHAGALVDAGELPGLPEGVARDTWFMDYRNADGSLAEMCGNGVRVFAHWLTARGLVDSPDFTVGTRAGGREVTVLEADDVAARVRVEMGLPRVHGPAEAVLGAQGLRGLSIEVGNPHLACVLPSQTPGELSSFPLAAPEFSAADFPEGANLEVLTALDPKGADGFAGTVAMRVFERGVGETRSCGTGTVAAARAALDHAGLTAGKVAVTVPGGRIDVEITPRGSALTGPSRLIAEARLYL